MLKRKTHLAAAKQHGQRAVRELRHMTADSALYWVLSHKGRIAQFRRAVRGTAAARPFERLLVLIRKEATAPARAAPRRARKPARSRRRRATRRRIVTPSFLLG